MKNYFGQAIALTSEANFSKFKGTMEAILDSFEVEIDY